MSGLQDLDTRPAAVTPEPVRVVVFAPDDELRAWLIEELSLMTWMGALQLDTLTSTDSLDPAALDLLIVDLDRMSAADVQAIATRSWSAPVIAIGTMRDRREYQFDQVLGSGLTSRELKTAIRQVVFDRR
ncbi:MAG: hypothetical protein HOV81_06910 [Kofleriaceae bacterium]|nr:hypothetical protein [Kofleriaceae bacterium]